MKREEILAMEAGEGLDKLVIQKIMHHIWDGGDRPRCKICGVWKDWDKPTACETKKYSTDISAAWQVVGKLIEDGYFLTIGYSQAEKDWGVSLDEMRPFVGDYDEIAWCKTAPEAICKVALLAKLEGERERKVTIQDNK